MGVCVGVLVGVLVGVSVGVCVGVSVGVTVGVSVGVTVGVSVGGTYSQVRYLLDEDLTDYDVVYLGGRDHVVSEAVKAELIAGGVGVTESNFTAI